MEINQNLQFSEQATQVVGTVLWTLVNCTDDPTLLWKPLKSFIRSQPHFIESVRKLMCTWDKAAGPGGGWAARRGAVRT